MLRAVGTAGIGRRDAGGAGRSGRRLVAKCLEATGSLASFKVYLVTRMGNEREREPWWFGGTGIEEGRFWCERRG